jgi:subtilase family serine protease
MTDRRAIAAAVAAASRALLTWVRTTARTLLTRARTTARALLTRAQTTVRALLTRAQTTIRTLPSTARTTILAVTAITGCVLLTVLGAAGDSRAVTAPARPATASGSQPPAPASPSGAPATPEVSAAPSHLAAPASEWCVRAFDINCYSPRQLEQAYGLPQLYARGLDGQGRTIVIVDAYGSPTIRHDLRVFDAGCGLPGPPSLRIIQPVGRVPPYDADDGDVVDAAAETTTDVEAAHSIAPGARILLVETPADETLSGGGFAQFMAAEDYVVRHGLGDVISQSFGLPEQNFGGQAAIRKLRYAFQDAYRHHVTVLAAANDFGVTGPTRGGGGFRTRPVVDWPASDPLVTGVGGTRLQLTAAGRRIAPDSAWNEDGNPTVARYAGALPWASSGGRSAVFTRPAYQDPVRGVTGGRRGVPDVALSASFRGGFLSYGSFTGRGAWKPAGGTSVATPMLAGLVAIADQDARARLGLINPALYRLAQAHAPGIVPVTRGSNTVRFSQGGRTVTVRGYPARAGYSLVTGVGTIDAARFVPELAAAKP